MIKAVLFDLDGTLLPMDLDLFVENYMKAIARRLAPLGFDPKTVINGVWQGVYAMVKNDGSRHNQEIFWEVFSKIPDVDDKVTAELEGFYNEDFPRLSSVCGFNEKSNLLIKKLKAKGYKVILATNPIFPLIAVESRIGWAGLDKADFDYITSYENSSFSKPNPKYYEEILNKNGLEANECIMVGNDVTEDGAARKIGIKTFILTDWLINKENADLNDFPHGSFNDLLNLDIEKI